ncbi:unnamed protein product, partial [Symbiodinium sp. CCMP2456]
MEETSTTEVHLGEGGHLLRGAVAGGVVEAAYDLTEGHGAAQALQDFGSCAGQNLAASVLMHTTGLPIPSFSDHHEELVFANGVSMGVGEQVNQFKTLDGTVSQHTSGLQIGCGIPGDPLGIVQAQATIGVTEDSVHKETALPGGTDTFAENVKTEGAEFRIGIGNFSTAPVCIGHVKSTSRDEVKTHTKGGGTKHEVTSRSYDGYNWLLVSSGSVIQSTLVDNISQDGVRSYDHCNFEGQQSGFNLGIVAEQHEFGTFEEQSGQDQHHWTTPDGVHHTEQSAETFQGQEDHVTDRFWNTYDHDVKTGTVQGNSTTSSSFHRTENGSEVTGAHSEVTDYEGDKSVDNGVVTAEQLQDVTDHSETHGYKKLAVATRMSMVQDGTETGPTGHEIGEDVSGTIDHTVMGGRLHLNKETFAIHDGEGTLHTEGLFTAVDVRGKMHYDETSGQVVVDAASDSFVLSANTNGAIAAATKVAFHTLLNKGYLEIKDVGWVAVKQFAQITILQKLAQLMGSSWLTMGVASCVIKAVYDIWAIVNWTSLSTVDKGGHTLITSVGLVCDIIICIAFASNPLLSAMLPASQIMREMVASFYDWCSGKITTQMFKTNLCAD